MVHAKDDRYLAVRTELARTFGGKQATRFVSVARSAEAQLRRMVSSDAAESEDPWRTCSNGHMSALVRIIKGGDVPNLRGDNALWSLKIVLHALFPGEAAVARWPALYNGSHVVRRGLYNGGGDPLPAEYERCLDALALRRPDAKNRRGLLLCVRDFQKRLCGDAPWDAVSDDRMREALARRAGEVAFSSFCWCVRNLRVFLEAAAAAVAVDDDGAAAAPPPSRWPSLYRPFRTFRPEREQEPPPSSVVVRRPFDDRHFRTTARHVREELLRLRTSPEEERRGGAVDERELAFAINHPETVSGTALPLAFYLPAHACVPPPVRAYICLRWDDSGEVLGLFAAIGAYAQRQRVTRLGYIYNVMRHFYEVCVVLMPRGALLPRLRSVQRSEVVRALRDRADLKGRGQLAHTLFQFCSRGEFRDLLPSWGAWEPIGAREIGYSRKRMERERSSFTLEELRRLFEATAAAGEESHALLRFFVHTGCRSRAATLLRLEDVWDGERCRPEGRVMEKFEQTFVFAIDPVLARALEAHIRANRVTHYVFPGRRGGGTRRTVGSIYHWLKTTCAAAGIHGNHVYVHALRRTFVTLLVEDGNRIEDVMTLVGHKNASVTLQYVDRASARARLKQTMVLPWMQPHQAALKPTAEALHVAAADDDDDEDDDDGEGGAAAPASTTTTTTTALVAAALKTQQETITRLTSVYNLIVGDILTPAQRRKLFGIEEEEGAAAVAGDSSSFASAEPRAAHTQDAADGHGRQRDGDGGVQDHPQALLDS